MIKLRFFSKGMYTPNSGTAYILGHDIRTQMSRIRTSIGFCPQSKYGKKKGTQIYINDSFNCLNIRFKYIV